VKPASTLGRCMALVRLRCGSVTLVQLCCISAALWEAGVVVSSSEMSVRSSITFTSICTERLFAQSGSNTRLLTASQASEAIKNNKQC